MNMSFMLTTGQIETQDKDVTRRIGWKHLKKGQRIQPIEKGQGLKKGEKIVLVGCPIIVDDVRRERLSKMTTEPQYGAAEANREGFPMLDGEGFVRMFCEHNACTPSQWVTRIQFHYETPRERRHG